MSKPKISVIGLGKLGAPMVAAYASKGYEVIGVDINPGPVGLINQGKPPVFEPRLAELLRENKERISATQSYEEAVLNSEITFIIVPTPSDENGGFSNKYVVEAGKEIGKALKKKPDFHLVNLVSTVIPGSTEGELKPILEEYSGKVCGKDFGLSYNPEFIALGKVIHDLLNPDLVMIGEFNKRSGDILEGLYKNICGLSIPIRRMNIVNAEIAKISLNVYITNKISYANMLAELCERFSGGDIDAITDAIGCDSRVGHKYLKGALGYGGPCFPRDTRAFLYTARKIGLDFPLPKAVEGINKRQSKRIVEKILSVLPKDGKVGILGLSYKPDTNVIEESQAVEIARSLAEKGISVSAYDPAAMENAKKILGDRIAFASSLKECLQNSNVAVIATPWQEFRNINPAWLEGKTEKPVLVDCWRILDQRSFGGKIKYIAIGINSDGIQR